MEINGKELSLQLIEQIKEELQKLAEKGIVPKIAIVTVGDDTSWKVYVGRKIKLADKLGIQKELVNLTEENESELLDVVKKLNSDKNTCGIIVQRPLPKHINIEKVISAISPEKDIDGFRRDSKFLPPLWLAVEHILEEIFKRSVLDQRQTFTQWLRKKRITVIGKGETGGLPVIQNLTKLGASPLIIDSKTQNREEILKESDIVISAVGKDRVVEAKDLKQGVILVGIGIHRGEDGKVHGDYDEEDVRTVASYYTPTPRGVGPLNLANLFKNLTEAAKNA